MEPLEQEPDDLALGAAPAVRRTPVPGLQAAIYETAPASALAALSRLRD